MEQPIDSDTIGSAFADTTVRITALPDATGIPVEWEFTNRGDFPLVVERFDESCGCLSGKTSSEGTKAVAPGESGVIRASFTPGSKRGLLRKSLHVRFVGHAKPIELVVEAKIAKSVELSGSDITWTADSPVAPRSLDITSGPGTDFTITGLGGITEAQFVISRKTITEKRHHRLTITPADGVSSGVHTLLVRTNSPDPRDRVMPVFLHIP